MIKLIQWKPGYKVVRLLSRWEFELVNLPKDLRALENAPKPIQLRIFRRGDEPGFPGLGYYRVSGISFQVLKDIFKSHAIQVYARSGWRFTAFDREAPLNLEVLYPPKYISTAEFERLYGQAQARR